MSWVLIVFMSRMLEKSKPKSFCVSSKADIKTTAPDLFTLSHNVLALLITSLFIRLLFHGNDLVNWADWKWHSDNFLFVQKKPRTDPLLVTPTFGLCLLLSIWGEVLSLIKYVSLAQTCMLNILPLLSSLMLMMIINPNHKSYLSFYFVFEWFPIEFWILSSIRRFFSSQKIFNSIQFTTSTTSCIW